MLHSKRIWSIVTAESAEWLAEQLTQFTWCGCNGFRLGDYVFVNDATCADGAQEYAASTARRRSLHPDRIADLLVDDLRQGTKGHSPSHGG